MMEETALIWAAFKDNLEIVRELIAHGANPNHPDNNGQAALYWVAWEDNLEMLRELLALGANPNQVTNGGYTAFYWAARNNNLEMFRELIADWSKSKSGYKWWSDSITWCC